MFTLPGDDTNGVQSKTITETFALATLSQELAPVHLA
jgi:hypothetical protein